ncbi:IS3 family transposase [Laribacter hongkongensis]|uniref:IS3 family transposase n=1 Tax=Laribacter hongkongensis TaxID=168471 RepID=UPI0023D7BBE7|nr:IS3 family transposase [Laribacter hongkongensis]MCG9029699.1 IS3 family transposase [Laribacter hongkongensis]MCG9035836.1 IS3 family transposase [Laribacter hongkongensis]MCG9038548.1 IS3 family transposase [Laribacter hongkongensis]MCG9071507.1 IS3 family transposase [Laribacter hongkongensis]
MLARGISERWVCTLVQIARNTLRHQPPPDPDRVLQQRLRELAAQRRRFGVPRLHVLQQQEGWRIKHKRVERLYRKEGCCCVYVIARSAPATCAWCCRWQPDLISTGR